VRGDGSDERGGGRDVGIDKRAVTEKDWMSR